MVKDGGIGDPGPVPVLAWDSTKNSWKLQLTRTERERGLIGSVVPSARNWKIYGEYHGGCHNRSSATTSTELVPALESWGRWDWRGECRNSTGDGRADWR